MRKVLLLNSSYEPLHICSWKRAVILLIKGKAVALEVEHQKKALSHHAVPGIHLQPLVIRLLYYVKMPHKEIPLTRRNVMHRDHYTCQYCSRKSELTIDHIIPRSKGGRDTWDNVVVACLRCNIAKGNKTLKEAGMELKRKPCRPVNFVHFELSKQHYQSIHQYEKWRKYLFIDDFDLVAEDHA